MLLIVRFFVSSFLFLVLTQSTAAADSRIGVGGAFNDINGELATGYSITGGSEFRPFWDYQIGWSNFGELDSFGGSESYWAIHGAIKPKYPLRTGDIYLLLGTHLWGGAALGGLQLQYGIGYDQRVAQRLMFSGEYKLVNINDTDIESLNFTLSYLF
jgi:hypothetical protein